MPEDWERALAVVAHPDDMEYGASSAVAGWTDAGKDVVYLLVTRGEAGIDAVEPAEAAALRGDEQRAACDAAGVQTLEFLDHPDGTVEYGLARRHRPDLVITLNHRETFGPGALNMADHRVVGQATIDAVRDAANRWVFSDAGEAWHGVRWVAVSGSPQPTHAVDIADTFDRGVESLLAHRVYLEGLGGGPMADPAAFLRSMATSIGERAGGGLATAFELFPM